jgi:DNA-binding winged helix-turn-helix (wHTH) protein
MTHGVLQFGDFTLDPANRTVHHAGHPVDLGGRYLDALALMAGHPGDLITKDRLLSDVWHGVPVTDEALTQCIRALRKTLGDDAANPRFIETVPRHGYRFIAPVTSPSATTIDIQTRESTGSIHPVAGGAAGGALAGGMVGLIHAFTMAGGAGSGSALSTLIVLVVVCMISATTGAIGIAAGVATARRIAGHASIGWVMAGGALGGLITGALGELIGKDAFTLLAGAAPADIAGAAEGLVMGTIVGAGVWLIAQRGRLVGALATGLGGAIAGMVLVALGGALMADSLLSLAQAFPRASLSLAPGSATLSLVRAAIEAGLFAACVALGIAYSRK